MDDTKIINLSVKNLPCMHKPFRRSMKCLIRDLRKKFGSGYTVIVTAERDVMVSGYPVITVPINTDEDVKRLLDGLKNHEISSYQMK